MINVEKALDKTPYPSLKSGHKGNITQHNKGLYGLPWCLAAKESACNAGDPGSIPGSGRSPGEGIGYPLQYSWASLVAQSVENLPVMWDTWVGKIPLEEDMATHSSILAWRIPMDRGAWRATVQGSQRVRHD